MATGGEKQHGAKGFSSGELLGETWFWSDVTLEHRHVVRLCANDQGRDGVTAPTADLRCS